ncbi:MAG: carotene hydroxylase [Bacteroidetes bacterium]|nr:MAG: carotene hydroxylase [Bacteroidota bacterium]
MLYLFYFFITLTSFAFMEGFAWFTHKYIMHGPLWFIHKSHHVISKGTFQLNDLFAVIFAVPSWLFMQFGVMDGFDYKFFIGTGITLYGAWYFAVHDVFVHQRIKWLKKTKNKYMQGLRRAHKVHHKSLVKDNNECFGFLLVPRKYHRQYNETSE